VPAPAPKSWISVKSESLKCVVILIVAKIVSGGHLMHLRYIGGGGGYLEEVQRVFGVISTGFLRKIWRI
jgi:hypothetical protein